MSGTGEAKDSRSLQLTLVAYGVIFTIKLVAYLMTGVLAMLAEALHTVSDMFVTGFLLVAVFYSRKRADADHMFGHGRAQNVAGLTAAVLFIAFTAYKLYEEAIPRLFRAEETTYENLGLAVGILVASMLIAAWPLVRLMGQRDRGAAAKAQIFGLVKDEIGLLAALLATLLIGFGYPIADPIASIVVATIIVWMGVSLFRDNTSMLLGRSPSHEYLAQLDRLALSVPGVLGVHEIRAEYVGPDTVHAGMHLEVAPGTVVEEVDRVAQEVRRRVHDEADTGYCVIQVEAAGSPAAHETTAVASTR
ncbi:MAG TPA: cation diffusion facilitator family transporter [Acidimicrobiia bacterium]